MTMNTDPAGAQVVCLITAPNPMQAHIWENALRAEGIRSQVVGDYLDSGIGDISGIRPEIWVWRLDFIRAKRVLRLCSQAKTAVSFDTATPEPPGRTHQISSTFAAPDRTAA
jgi:hypothetical protein